MGTSIIPVSGMLPFGRVFSVWHLAGAWLSRFGLHILHPESLQSLIKWGPTAVMAGSRTTTFTLILFAGEIISFIF